MTPTNHDLRPAVNRQPWFPRGMTRREAPAAPRALCVLLYKPELRTVLPELMKMTQQMTFVSQFSVGI